jgi:phosphoserine phosphatase RsbU/P
LIPKVVKARRQKDEEQARFARSIINMCIDNGQAILLEDAQSGKSVKVTESISEFRIRSVMCAPLKGADGQVFGVIQLDTQDRVKKFTHEDLELLVAVSNQAAVAMDNARLHEEKMELERRNRDIKYAIQVQQSFLPSVLPTVAGYEFFAHYKPARDVGGDLYSFVTLPGDRLAVSIGDVSGKGVPAALLMARVIADIRYCVTSEPNPATAVRDLNKLFGEAGFSEKFVTFALAALHAPENRLTVVNAGHIPLLVRRAANGAIEVAGSGDQSGLPLGVLEDTEYQACQLQLQPGDIAVLLTDGILEAMNAKEEQFGDQRIREVLQAAPSSVKKTCALLLEAVERFVAGHQQSDDITLVGIGRSA